MKAIANWAFLLLAVLAFPPASIPASDDAKLIARWVEALDSDNFAEREAASANLINSGRVAIPAVAAAALRGKGEGSMRAFRILRKFGYSTDVDLAAATVDALPRR